MSQSNTRDRHSLNGLLDGELDPQQTAELQQRLREDPALRKHYRDLHRVRTMLQSAMYRESPARMGCRRHTAFRPLRWAGRAVAASLLVALGVGLGWWLHPIAAQDGLSASLSTGAVAIRPVAYGATAQPARAIIHVSSADAERVERSLDEAERLLRDYRAANKQLLLEIIANEDGLRLMRADTSPARERIGLMLATYANLKFLACGKSVERARRETGREVQLLPKVEVVPSALDKIIQRLESGWTYVRT